MLFIKRLDKVLHLLEDMSREDFFDLYVTNAFGSQILYLR